MTKIIQSKELTAFYNAYNDWLEAGAPEENEYDFRRRMGLCRGIKSYFSSSNKKYFLHQLEMQFSMAGLDDKFPFGEARFLESFNNTSQHLDPNRIRWVKAHLTRRVDMEFTLQ